VLKLTHVAKILKHLFVGYGQAPPRLSLPQNVLDSNILTCTSLIQTKIFREQKWVFSSAGLLADYYFQNNKFVCSFELYMKKGI
jgi:hypothetical protein